MWPFTRKVRQRRLEVRKNIPSASAERWRQFRQAGGIVSLGLALALLAGAVAMDISPPDPLTYRVNQYVPEDIHSRVEFRILSESAKAGLERDLLQTREPVFRLNESLVEQIIGALRNLPKQLKATTQPADLDEQLQKQFSLTAQNVMQVREALFGSEDAQNFESSLTQLSENFIDMFIVQPDAKGYEVWRASNSATLVRGKYWVRKAKADCVDLTEEGRVAEQLDRAVTVFDPRLRTSILAYLTNALDQDKAVYVYDAAVTQENIAQAVQELHDNPPSGAYVPYVAGQILVASSRSREAIGKEKLDLTGDELELLTREHEYFLAAEITSHPLRMWGRLAGRAIIVTLLIVLCCLYTATYEPKIIRNHWQGMALVLLMLIGLGLSKALVFVFALNTYSAMFAVLSVTLVLAIAYDRRFALALGGVLSVLVVLQVRAGFAELLVLLTGAAAGVFLLAEIRSRSRVIKVSGMVALLAFAMTCATSLAAAMPLRVIFRNGFWAAAAALLVGLLVEVILPLIERVFRVATSMTLLEWCDASKPLLKRLATEAPGTYNHCLQLGSMCESAADAIGAKGLLARVGAYYHDIGKINKPDYFVENQSGKASKHDKLSPAMSLLIIVGHVKDGLEMAHEYALPVVLHEFIETHHGTTLVQYFYHAATAQRKNDTERAPDEVEFRYPGPKPQSREAGILMLADASESSVRAMTEPTPGRIENQVHTMVNRRLMDGQLDECEMTLREVHQVEASLTKSLCSIYHSRIAYPTPPGQKPSAAELEAAANKAAKATAAKAAAEATAAAQRPDSPSEAATDE